MSTIGLSTEKLIRLAFEYRLISDYRMTPSCIELDHADATFSFDPEEARFFLRGLVQGYRAHAQRENSYPVRVSGRIIAAA